MNWHGICGERILQILVEKSGQSFEELCDDLGVETKLARSGLMEVYYCLLSLNEFGLITVDDIGNDTQHRACKALVNSTKADDNSY